MNSDNSDEHDVLDARRSKKHKKDKKRKHKKAQLHDHRDRRSYDSDASDSESEAGAETKCRDTAKRYRDSDEGRRKKKRKDREREREKSSSRRKSHERERSRKRRDYVSSSSSDSGESSGSVTERSISSHRRDRERRKSRSGRKHKRERKHSSHRKDKRRRRDRDERRHAKEALSSKTSDNASSGTLSKYDSLLPQLYDLLSQHPGLATELPYILIRVASGSSIHLSQVSDPSVASGFRQIFQTLGCTCTGDEWKFDDGGRIKKYNGAGCNDSDLVLIKLVTYLMDEKGFTINAVENFENSITPMSHQITNGANDKISNAEAQKSPPSIYEEIGSLTSMLLEKFQAQQKDKKSSLAKELYDIFNMIQDKEIICLDAIPDQSLRESMEKLFMIIGLSKEEMEAENDDDDEDEGNDDVGGDEQEASFGFVLPEETDVEFDRIMMKIDAAVTACKTTHQEFIQSTSTKRTLGPSLPPTNASTSGSAFDQHDSDDDEDDVGPAPLGEMVKSRKVKGPALSSTELKQLVKEREAQMVHVTTGIDPNASTSDGAREEWMIQPGEHDFLKGVLSKGIKNRTFKNEKGRAVESALDVPLDPAIQKQVDSIIKMHEEARGPSLIEQHRLKRAEEKMAAVASKGGKGNDWCWNREKDLDSGRRVDKSHLQMVMGGASKDLKNKFSGSYSKSFT